MPWKDIKRDKFFVSKVIIAVSGKFSENAKEKIKYKVLNYDSLADISDLKKLKKFAFCKTSYIGDYYSLRIFIENPDMRPNSFVKRITKSFVVVLFAFTLLNVSPAFSQFLHFYLF